MRSWSTGVLLALILCGAPVASLANQPLPTITADQDGTVQAEGGFFTGWTLEFEDIMESGGSEEAAEEGASPAADQEETEEEAPPLTSEESVSESLSADTQDALFNTGSLPLAAYGLIFTLAGIALAIALYLLFRARLDAFFDMLTGYGASGHAHHDGEAVLTDTVYGYYHHDNHSDQEYISPLLRNFLHIDDYSHGLRSIYQALEKDSAIELQLLVSSLEKGESGPLYSQLKVKKNGTYLECIGLAEGDAPGDEDMGHGNKRAVEGFTLWFRDISADERMRRGQEEELESSRQQLRHMRAIMDQAPFPVWQRDKQLKILYCNHAYAAIVEKEAEEIIGGKPVELDTEVRRLAEKAKGSNSLQSVETHIVVQGKRKLFNIVEQPLLAINERGGDEHEPIGFAGYAYDLCGKEEIEAELKRMMAAQSDFLESSASAMVIYGKDMRLKHYNNAFLRLWGLEESWVEEEPTYGDVLEMLRQKRRLPEQANFPAFKQQNLEMFTKLIKPHEEFYYIPDGTILRVIIIPHSLGGLLFAYEDVTDRLALERNYNTLIAVQRASLDHLHEGVAVFGEDGRLKLFNPEYARLWKLADHQLENQPHISELAERVRELFVLEEDWTAYKQRILSMFTNRETRNGRLHRADGSVLDWRCVPLPDGATLMAYYDVTDSTLVEQTLMDKNKALEEADRVKTEFLASMSYELRSPLTSIMGFSEALTHSYFGELNQKQEEYVGAIYASSKKLMTLINDILDLASIEAGYLSLTLSTIDVGNLLASVIEMQEERARDRSLSLRMHCPEDIGTITADEARLKQLLFNLLHNAIKYTAPGGEIEIGARPSEGDAQGEIMEIWVRDNGVGIPEEEQANVFKRFYKGGSAKGHKAGAGLGLSMVRRFAELHGGSVRLESEVGKGTTVYCELPRTVPEELTLPPDSAAAPQPQRPAAGAG